MPGRRRSRRRVRVCVVEVMVFSPSVEVVRPADILMVLGAAGGWSGCLRRGYQAAGPGLTPAGV